MSVKKMQYTQSLLQLLELLHTCSTLCFGFFSLSCNIFHDAITELRHYGGAENLRQFLQQTGLNSENAEIVNECFPGNLSMESVREATGTKVGNGAEHTL